MGDKILIIKQERQNLNNFSGAGSKCFPLHIQKKPRSGSKDHVTGALGLIQPPKGWGKDCKLCLKGLQGFYGKGRCLNFRKCLFDWKP